MRTCSQHTGTNSHSQESFSYIKPDTNNIQQHGMGRKEATKWKRLNFIIFVIDPHFAFSPLVMALRRFIVYIFFKVMEIGTLQS